MPTAVVSTIKNLSVADIGSVELTVEERGDGQPFCFCMEAPVPTRSPNSPSYSARTTTTASSFRLIPALVAHRGRIS
jgi:hypothetical protein